MKRLLLFLALCFVSSASLLSSMCEVRDICFDGALTAGAVFKHDGNFKKVYGHTITNCITADGCYYPWQHWGVGAKISYWQAHGCTTFLKRRTHLQEVPLTFYLRRKHDFDCGLQLYASLGGGVIWVKEKSYLGKIKMHKGIGEVEVGLNYPLWRSLNVTGAYRYLFPHQSPGGRKVTLGGSDVRAGLAVLF